MRKNRTSKSPFLIALHERLKEDEHGKDIYQAITRSLAWNTKQKSKLHWETGIGSTKASNLFVFPSYPTSEQFSDIEEHYDVTDVFLLWWEDSLSDEENIQRVQEHIGIIKPKKCYMVKEKEYKKMFINEIFNKNSLFN